MIILFYKIIAKTALLLAVLVCVSMFGGSAWAAFSVEDTVGPTKSYGKSAIRNAVKTVLIMQKTGNLQEDGTLAKTLVGASLEKVAEASAEEPVELSQVPEPEPVKDYEWFRNNPDDPEALGWVKANLDQFYTAEEIRQTSLIVEAEDLVAYSYTIWAAHVWVVLNRVGAPGFKQNGSIIGVLSAPGQFTTYKKKNLEKAVNSDIEWLVRDVFARKVLEDWGASPETVGRTLPATHKFFKASGGKYDYFYEKCWKGRYDPFSSPFNPYDN